MISCHPSDDNSEKTQIFVGAFLFVGSPESVGAKHTQVMCLTYFTPVRVLLTGIRVG